MITIPGDVVDVIAQLVKTWQRHEEVDPQITGELQLVDSENNVARDITVTPSLIAAYKAEFARYCESIENYCLKYQLGYVRTTTDFPFEELVLDVFRQGRFLK